MEKWPVRERENPGSQRRKCLKREGMSVLLENADMPSGAKSDYWILQLRNYCYFWST